MKDILPTGLTGVVVVFENEWYGCLRIERIAAPAPFSS
jgi:hypothetical protein